MVEFFASDSGSFIVFLIIFVAVFIGVAFGFQKRHVTLGYNYIYQRGRKLIFCFGFNKSDQDNLSDVQRKLLNKLSDSFQNMADEVIIKNIKHNELVRITGMEAQL